MTDLNIHLFTPEEAVRYIVPTGEVDQVLYNLLKNTVNDQEQVESDTETEICDLHDKIEKLENEKESLEYRLEKYEDFFSYISCAYEKVDGTWPKCEIDNDSWADAIYNHIVNNPLKTDES